MGCIPRVNSALPVVWGIFLVSSASADLSAIDTGTLSYWDGNLPAPFVYKSPPATPPDVDTGTMDYVDELGLPVQYLFEGYFGPHGPSVVGWFSVRTHGGGVGEMVLELGSANVTSEPRGDGIQELRAVFSGPVEAADGSLDVGDVAVSGLVGGTTTPSAVNLSVDGLTLHVYFAPGVLADRDTYGFDITGRFVGQGSGLAVVSGGGGLVCMAKALVGDVNSSGTVNLIDVGAVRTMKNSTVDVTDFSYDINLDGAIDLLDVALVRSLHGNLAPANPLAR